MRPGIGDTYWYDHERGGQLFLGRDRVAEHDGWAWMRVKDPWMRIPGQFAGDSQFRAGFSKYGDARDDLQFALRGYREGGVEGAAALRASKLHGGLVLCFPTDFAFAIFAVRRGIVPDREGPARFAAWRSRLPQDERFDLLRSGKPKIWSL